MDIKNLTQSEHNDLLKMLIPHLNEFKFKKGGEGKVYFIDDDLIVKKFKAITISVNNSFGKYYAEMKRFHDLGYSVPNIYAYEIIDDMANPNRGLYLLEERAKGRELYYNGDLEKAYDLCKNLCSKRKFKEAIRVGGSELFDEIIYTYLNDFYQTNQDLLKLPDDVIEKFILSAFNMNIEGRHNYPDLVSVNVLFDKQNLTIIDNAYSVSPLEFKDRNSHAVSTLGDMINLFHANATIHETTDEVFGMIINKKRISELVNSNKEICGNLIRRIVRKTNELISPVVKSEYDILVDGTLDGATFKKDADQIYDEIQKEY